MDLGIKGKLALVLGATGNTGREVALALAREGCRLVVVARGAERLYDLAAASPTPTVAWPADLTDESKLDDLITVLPRDVGTPEIIVHVMGGSGGIKDAMLPWSEWAKVQRLNLGIAHEINRAFIPAMLDRGWGRIVHFSSNGVKLAIGNCPYTSAKSAVEGYVRTVSKQFSARGVVISAVSPGPIKTDGRFLYSQDEAWTKQFIENFVPSGRWGSGSELAGVVAFLCSDLAGYMAGAVVDVDGGMR